MDNNFGLSAIDRACHKYMNHFQFTHTDASVQATYTNNQRAILLHYTRLFFFVIFFLLDRLERSNILFRM